jgi:hypothetical protein
VSTPSRGGAELGGEVACTRQIICAVADINLLRASKGSRHRGVFGVGEKNGYSADVQVLASV